ncbi:MAG: TonB-dependent receptor [Burkholderiales bacterium]|nr:TonB-dependent receptor [Burkholderiales bacterium]
MSTHQRRQPQLRLNPVAAAAATLLFGALPVLAQQADNTAPQTVVVTGIRHSIESSIAKKRESDNVIEAITAEDIGKLPDISIAESLSRLPGLAAQRVDGRAQVIAIRGLSPDFAGTLLNGREQTTTGINRGVEFDQYPAELMSGAVVYKTPSATLLGQGLSGTIDLQTVRPLAVEGRRFAIGARVEHNSLGALNGGYGDTSANGGRFSVSYIDQFADHQVGVAVGFAHLDAPGQELHYKAWGFQDDSNCLSHPEWGCGPVNGLPAGANYANGFEVEALSRRDIRDGLMAALEYKPNKDLHSTLDLYYSNFKQKEVMRGLMGSVGDGWSGVTSGSTFSNVGVTNVGGIPLATSGTTTGGPPMIVRNDYNTRNDKLSSLGWNTEAKFGDWKAIADLSYSNTKRFETLFETYAGMAAPTNLQFTIPTGGGFPTLVPGNNYADPAQVLLSDPGGWGHDGRLQDSWLDDTIKALNVHVQHDFEGPISRIDAGVNFSQRDKQRNFLVYFASLKSGGKTQALAAGQAMAPVSLGFAGIPGVLSYDVNQIAGQYYTMTQNMSNGPTGDYSRDFGVHEKITTAYVKADINTDWGAVPITGNMGLQMIHTNQSSNAFAFDSSNNTAGTISPGTSYNDFLPSLNLVGDIGGNRKLRLGLARTLARPRIDDMNASSSASVATTGAAVWSGSGGNPRLQPWRANSFDLSLEQYMGKRSYVAGALFYKQLVSYVYKQTINYDFTGFVNGNPKAPQPISPYGLYSTQANGHGGNLHGVELTAVLDGGLISPGLEGFGTEMTASFTSSSIQVQGPGTLTPTWATLPGLSKTVAGLTLYYEKDGVSVRVNDRYRSDYRGEYSSLFGATSVYRTPAQNQVDFQASYEFQSGPTKGLSFLFQVVNLTNAADRTLQDGSGFGGIVAPQENNKYGRQYLFGVNYKM